MNNKQNSEVEEEQSWNTWTNGTNHKPKY